MKKLIALLGVVILIAVAWWRYDSRDPELRDPEVAVQTLMGELAQISALAWDKSRQEKVQAALEQARENPGTGLPDEVQPLARGIGRFFAEPGIGKGVLTVFLIIQIDTYTVEEARPQDARVRVPVVITPKDILGVRGITTRLGVPEPQIQAPKPQRLEFLLESDKRRWRIVDVEGDLAKIIRRFRR